MIIMIRKLPRNLQQLLEEHGIENDSLSDLDGSLVIEIEDLNVAFQIREATLDFHPCCLISHPISKNPALIIHNLLKNQ